MMKVVFILVLVPMYDVSEYDVSTYQCTVPEIIDPVFAKTSQNARFLLSENERFGLVFVKTGSINSGTVPNVLKKFEGR
jgi:hypothetical protein